MGQRIEINPLTGMPEITAAAYGLSVRGVTNSDMTPSATAIVCGDLAGYGDDYFNGYFLQVITGNHELLTIDGAPAPADFAAGATLEGATSGETCEVVAKLTSTTYIVKERSGTFTDGEVISDGTNSIDCGAGYPTFAAGAAPEKQSRAVTDYVSATGTFTTAAFGQVVEPLSEVLFVHDSLLAIGTNDANNTFDSSAVTANRDGSVLERTEFIIDALQGTQFRTERSAAGTVEENGIQQFTISLYDLDLGAIASADINITAITNVMSKSAGGAAFSAAGITQPTFAKANGIVACSYQFLAAEWAVGDIYRLVVEGITATVDTETVYCPTMVWSNAVLEASTIDTNVETILAELAGGAGVASFPAAADAGDGVSLAEVLRAILTSMVGGDDFDAYTNISNTANASLNAIAQKFAAVIGCDNTNTFSSTIQGSARTTIEAALDALATYFAASGAAMAMKVQDGTERTNLEQILEDYFAVVGCDGTNLFNPTIQGAAQTTLDAALAQLAVYFAASGAAMSVQLNNQTARTNLEQILEDYFVLVGVDGTNVLTNINNSANATFNAVWQKFAALWGADGANVFNPTISGAERTDLDAALGALAGQVSPSAAAISVTMNNGAAVSTLEEIWEAWLAVVGVAGANQFTNISNSANTTINAVIQKFAAVLGIDATNAFNPSMFGATPATVEAAFTALGTALGAEFDGSPDIYDTLVTGFDSSGVTNNFDGSILEVAKAGLEKTTLGAYDPDTDSNEAISGKVDDLDADLVAAKAVIDDIHADLVTAAAYIDTEVAAIQAKTDLLPTDPADQSAVEAAITAAHAVTDGKVDGVTLADYDDFDVADADANTERWNVGYINGTEGGSADINTTTAGKLMVKVDPDATPTAAGYSASLAQPVASKRFSVVVDVDATFGTPSGSWATVGMRISPAAYDTNNVVYLQRQNSTAGVQNRIAAGAIFASANQGEVYFTTSDSAVAFKIERLDNVWRLYYSLTQYPNYAWVLLTQYEDSAEGMDSLQVVYLDAYSPGTADAETAQGDFDNFKFYLNSAGLAQAVAGDYDSSAVAADEDGSVIERLEQIQEAVNRGTGSSLPADKSLYDGLTGGIDAVNRRAGNLQMKPATIDLQQAAGSYDLFTGTTQDVMLETLVFRVPNVNVSDDATITSISIQTNDATPQVLISSALGAKANLTAEAQIWWKGAVLIKAGKKIQLTIAGGAADAATVCDVAAGGRAIVGGGYLLPA